MRTARDGRLLLLLLGGGGWRLDPGLAAALGGQSLEALKVKLKIARSRTLIT